MSLLSSAGSRKDKKSRKKNPAAF